MSAKLLPRVCQHQRFSPSANDLTQMQVIANIDQADIGLVNRQSRSSSRLMHFRKDFDGKIEEMRLNPVNVQNVVTYNVVIDVNNPNRS